MTSEEYRANYDDIRAGIISLVLSGPSDSEARTMIAAIERVHAVGPFIDPTRYQARLHDGALDVQQAIVQAYIDLRRAARKVDPHMAMLMDAQDEASVAR